MTQQPPHATALGRMIPGSAGACWYDTNRNAFCAVDPVLADVLPVFGEDNDDAVLARLAGRHPAAALREAMAEIRRARRDEGLFALTGPPVAVPLARIQGAGDAQPVGQLTLGLSERCNLRCAYCTQAAAPSFGDRVMSADTACRAVRWFAARCGGVDQPHVSFYGGEPLLHLEVIEAVVAEVRRHPAWPELAFSIDTNATLIDERAARFIAAEQLHLQVSLDGPPEVHDRHRRRADGAPTHAAIMAGLRRLLSVDPSAAARIRFVATVTPPYDFCGLADYFAAFPLFREFGRDDRPSVRLNTANLDGSPLAAVHDDQERARQWRAGMAAARARYAAAHREGRRAELPPALAGLLDGALVRWHHRRREPRAGAQFPGGACRPGGRRVFVAPDGTFLPCERAGADWPIGNVDKGLDEGAVVALHEALLDVLDGACRTCWAQRLCGVCFTAVHPGWPRQRARDEARRTCAAVRGGVAKALALYLQLWQEEPDSLAFLADTEIV